MSIIERLYTKSIARDEELAFVTIPDCERKHSAEIVNTRRTVFFVEMKNGFSVAMRIVDVSAFFEFTSVIGVIVNLAVVRDLQRAIFVGHRLMTRSNVYDAQTSVTKGNAAVDEDTSFVGTTMRYHITHAQNHLAIHLASRMRR